jgi:hypothetical protein
MSQRQYRFPRKGNGVTEYLTDRQLHIAEAIGVQWHPTVHSTSGWKHDAWYSLTADAIEVECPTPHICGWFCSVDDELKIKRVEGAVSSNAGLYEVDV